MNGQSERGSVVVYIWSMTSVVKTKMLSMIEQCVLVVMILRVAVVSVAVRSTITRATYR
jgi:membrane glycosyltransferase